MQNYCQCGWTLECPFTAAPPSMCLTEIINRNVNNSHNSHNPLTSVDIPFNVGLLCVVPSSIRNAEVGATMEYISTLVIPYRCGILSFQSNWKNNYWTSHENYSLCACLILRVDGWWQCLPQSIKYKRQTRMGMEERTPWFIIFTFLWFFSCWSSYFYHNAFSIHGIFFAVWTIWRGE